MYVQAAIAAATIAASIWSESKAQASKAASEAEAKAILQSARDEIARITPPDPKDQELFYEKFESQGELKPIQEQTVSAGPSAAEGISTDPALAQAQMSALAKLQEVGEEGLTAEDKYAMSQIQRSNAQVDRGARDAIMQGQQRRGMGGSNQELLMKLQSQQSSTDRNSQEGMAQASMAQQRALQAMQSQGALAGNMRGQEFSEKDKIAQSRDAMSKFNADLMAGANERNVRGINQADASNLANKQSIANSNVDLNNTQQAQNKGLLQTQFDNQMNKATGGQSATNNVANNVMNTGNTQAANSRKSGQIATDVLTSGGNMYNNYEDEKKDKR